MPQRNKIMNRMAGHWHTIHINGNGTSIDEEGDWSKDNFASSSQLYNIMR